MPTKQELSSRKRVSKSHSAGWLIPTRLEEHLREPAGCLPRGPHWLPWFCSDNVVPGAWASAHTGTQACSGPRPRGAAVFGVTEGRSRTRGHPRRCAQLFTPVGDRDSLISLPTWRREHRGFRDALLGQVWMEWCKVFTQRSCTLRGADSATNRRIPGVPCVVVVSEQMGSG